MAVMDSNIFSPLGIFFSVIFLIESIISLLGNGFILVVYGQTWLRSRKMILSEFLLTTLSLSRFLLQSVMMSSPFVYFSSPETLVHNIKSDVFAFTWMYLNTASLWCVTWLNVFYCVKVINFSHPLFLWLKARIEVLVPRFLGISVLVSIICTVPPIVAHYEVNNYHNLTGNQAENTSQRETSSNYSRPMLYPVRFSLTSICCSICISASILLLVSLWKHKRNLKRSGLITEDLSTKAHLSVMKALLLMLFFYILHFPAMIIVVGDIFKYGKLERLISDIVLVSYSSVHPVILIFTNPKLKKVCLHILDLRRIAS